MNNSAKTAISRTEPSAPTQWLVKNKMIRGSVLDYGCGLGKDYEYLSGLFFDVGAWDPAHRPDETPLNRKYDTVVCNYVLNVIPDLVERQAVVEKIVSLLNPGGKAFIAVRADLKALKGRTSTGTWQGYVRPEGCALMMAKKGAFEIYEVTADATPPSLYNP